MAQNKHVTKVGSLEIGNFQHGFQISKNKESWKLEVSPIGGLPISNLFSAIQHNHKRDLRALRAREEVRRAA
jgi:hypothetical protein